MIENFIDKKFFTGISREIVYIEKIGDDDYILSNSKGYLANIEKVNSKGFRWYTFFLGKQVNGNITFAHIEENLVRVIDKEPTHSFTTNTTKQ